VLPAEDRAVALGAGHSVGVTVAGIALLAVVARQSGTAALAGVTRTALPALLAGLLAGTAGLLTARALGADPVPTGSVPAAIGIGVTAGGVVLAVVAAVMMGTSRRPLRTAVSGLRRSSGGSDGGSDSGSDGGPSRGSSSASNGAEVAGV
jgi:putative peptidoglycan lipid II flippase